MKTSELTDAALDWAVEECEGRDFPSADAFCGIFNPSTNWAQGGPIIEREEISVNWANGQWEAHTVNEQDEYDQIKYGPTPLIAAMRCYVAAKWNDEVEIPEELK